MPTCFIDTKILLYAKDTSERSKLTVASRWIETLLRKNLAVLSAQSLREYYSNMLRLDRRPQAAGQLRAEMAVLDRLVPDDLRFDRMREAWALQDRHRLSFWDAMHIASALAAGCTIFLSEDMTADRRSAR